MSPKTNPNSTQTPTPLGFRRRPRVALRAPLFDREQLQNSRSADLRYHQRHIIHRVGTSAELFEAFDKRLRDLPAFLSAYSNEMRSKSLVAESCTLLVPAIGHAVRVEGIRSPGSSRPISPRRLHRASRRARTARGQVDADLSTAEYQRGNGWPAFAGQSSRLAVEHSVERRDAPCPPCPASARSSRPDFPRTHRLRRCFNETAFARIATIAAGIPCPLASAMKTPRCSSSGARTRRDRRPRDRAESNEPPNSLPASPAATAATPAASAGAAAFM